MELWMLGWYAVGLLGSREVAAQFMHDTCPRHRNPNGSDLAMVILMWLVCGLFGPVAFVGGLAFRINRYLAARPRKASTVKKWIQWFFTTDRTERKKVLNNA